MIVYETRLFGLSSLTRVHGSAVYKTVLPALLSTAFLLILYYYPNGDHYVEHPYGMGAFVVFFSFLLTFRLNFSYQRYWEGATTVHQMLSKWLDCAMNLAAYHYQSRAYDDLKPPTLGSQPDNATLTWDRKKLRFVSNQEYIETLRAASDERSADESNHSESKRRVWWKKRRGHKIMASITSLSERQDVTQETPKSINTQDPSVDQVQSKIPIPQRFQEQFTLPSSPGSGKRMGLAKQRHGSRHLVTAPQARLPLPSLFLQEVAHLLSLTAAVALSTLRNDIEFAESPLVEYVPGKPWPPVDPDQLSRKVQDEYHEGNACQRAIYFCLGLSRSNHRRTLYNAARPFAVLGGVSDEEIAQLQRARGPDAKVALCSLWVQEFISREYMAGSTGSVAPPIISRLYQMISDGMIGYNQARKVAYVPFPFAHSQTTAFFTFASIWVFPFLYVTYVNLLWFAALLNFATVICFLGLYEVARELENPFQNVPNDLPLCTFQAQFNEALVTVYAGYHPDAWWDRNVSTRLDEESEEED